MSMVLKAIQFGINKHQGQTRKVSGADYISHPITVSYLVTTYKKSKRLDELVVAAILHDTLEDTNTSFIELASEFTPLVASLVLELTNDQNQIDICGKLEYQKKKLVGMSSYGLIIKLVDRLHNISDFPTDRMIGETIFLMTHLQKNRKLSKTHKTIIKDILILCKQKSLNL